MSTRLLSKKTVSLFHALSDETRLALIDQLKNGERCVCELTDAMKAGQSRLSFHLKVLKDAGLITSDNDLKQAVTRLETYLSTQKSTVMVTDLVAVGDYRE